VVGDRVSSGALLPQGDDGVLRVGGQLRVADVYVNGWPPMKEMPNGHVIAGGVVGVSVDWSKVQSVDARAAYARKHFHPASVITDGESGSAEEFDGMLALQLVAEGERLYRAAPSS
jgi:hypothetical protein